MPSKRTCSWAPKARNCIDCSAKKGDQAGGGYLLLAIQIPGEAESGRVADRPEFSKVIDEARMPKAAFREILVGETQQQQNVPILLGGGSSAVAD